MIDLVLLSHKEQIRVYAYAYHDKDIYLDGDREGEIKEPHYHILLVTYNQHTVSAVRRWFWGFYDSEEKLINTLGQVCKDKYAYYDYLTHSDPQSIAEGKYQYSKDIIVCNDKKHFSGHISSDYDSAQLIITDMLNHTPYEVMWKKYGRDFILNFDKYKFFCDQLCIYEKFDIENEFCVNARMKRELNIDF